MGQYDGRAVVNFFLQFTWAVWSLKKMGNKDGRMDSWLFCGKYSVLISHLKKERST